ncbi:hypothetical protein L249_1924 [Ophiocordyceps polyrhachis-furcata BCC 54312]|uniref:Fungal lipase-type domain-containing protein n=1 Tax=Ophiocordyceps polyrhachis-furcata BCC 54312 TaxID=1330021 RepID=A0A367LQI5_9HYPO|nr:hypothetical protein L249_1924 [Ophiocordyceps polyrhachis-furcata BCC 54312]
MQLLTALQVLLAALQMGICNGQQKTLPAEKITAEQLHLFSKYAHRAYCGQIYGQPLDSSLCAEGPDPAKSKCKGLGKAVIVRRFKYESGNVPGYMAVDADKKLIVVAFRGTDIKSWANIKVDLSKVEVPSIFHNRELCRDCWLHSGFASAFDDMSAAVEDGLGKELDKMGPEGVRVVVTGHSLGGAIATIAGSYLRTRFPKRSIDIYTFGSPRVGNQAFAKFVMEQKNGVTVRVTKKKDFVTSVFHHIPPFLDYTHVYPEVWLKEGLKTVAAFENPYQDAPVTQCNERRCGSDSCGLSFIDSNFIFTCTKVDHSNYAGNFPCGDEDGDEDGRDETDGEELQQIVGDIQSAVNKVLARQFLLFAAHAVQPAYEGSERLCDVLRQSRRPYVPGLCTVRVTLMTHATTMTAAEPENLLILSFHEPERKTRLTKAQRDFSLVCRGCRVNGDFLQALEAIIPPPSQTAAASSSSSSSSHHLLWAVDQLKAKYASERKPVHRVVFTGYCGGGAMATLAAAYGRMKGFPIDLYTYGSPRVGNEAFANFVTNYDRAVSARITGGGHEVVLRPDKTDGYSHYGPEFYFPQGLVEADQGKNLRICGGVEAKGCSVDPPLMGASAVGGRLVYPSKEVFCSSFDPSTAV